MYFDEWSLVVRYQEVCVCVSLRVCRPWRKDDVDGKRLDGGLVVVAVRELSYFDLFIFCPIC